MSLQNLGCRRRFQNSVFFLVSWVLQVFCCQNRNFTWVYLVHSKKKHRISNTPRISNEKALEIFITMNVFFFFGRKPSKRIGRNVKKKKLCVDFELMTSEVYISAKI